MKTNEFMAIRRKELGLTLEEVAQRCGVGKSTVRKWEKGLIKNMGRDKIDLLASVLQVSPVLLLKDDFTSDDLQRHFKRVPMLGYAAAGAPLEDVNQDTPYYDIDNRYKVDFCITISGDSMVNAGINDGDIVFIKQQPEVEVGQIGCFEIDGERVCLKRFYKTDTGVMLVSENPKYAPMIFNSDNCQDFRCLGLAVLKQSVIK